MSDTPTRYEQCRRLLARHSQEHLLRFWPELDESQRCRLLDDLDQIDFAECTRLVESLVVNQPRIPMPEKLEPAEVLPHTADASRESVYRDALRRGQESIRKGRVAAFTVAGGQGTRLGFDGPKGAFEISPIRSACLFQLFAEYLAGVERRYGRRPPWYIMTSSSNHAATVELFESHDYFGLSAADVSFFEQGQMPAFGRDGRMLLSEPHRVALAPDGHGGSLSALARSGSLSDMAERGVDIISYFQVDNPLVAAIDPLFIGLHETLGSEFSSKAVTKADDLERVGNFCIADGQLKVIEYSDLSDESARRRNPDGTRRFDAGSIAIHVFDRAFVERITSGDVERLPWHRAEKKVTTVDESGRPVAPESPNAVKLESFVFDAIPMARNPMVMYTRREEEFSPVKNAEGADSAGTARRDMVRRAARWLEACGVAIRRDSCGEPALPIEISPSFALDAEDLKDRLTPQSVTLNDGPILLC